MYYITRIAKYVLFLFNFSFSICAIALIVFGVIYFIDEQSGVNVFSDLSDFFSLGIIAMVFGVVILFVAGFGYLGALHQHSCLLTTYAVILIVLFAFQLAFGILTIIKVINEDTFFKDVRDLIQEMFDKNDFTSASSFDNLQKQFHCCGVQGPSDYRGDYPVSCCSGGGNGFCLLPYETGCAQAFTDSVRTYIEIISYVALAFSVVELVGIVFSFLLRSQQNRYKRRLQESAA